MCSVQLSFINETIKIDMGNSIELKSKSVRKTKSTFFLGPVHVVNLLALTDFRLPQVTGQVDIYIPTVSQILLLGEVVTTLVSKKRGLKLKSMEYITALFTKTVFKSKIQLNVQGTKEYFFCINCARIYNTQPVHRIQPPQPSNKSHCIIERHIGDNT